MATTSNSRLGALGENTLDDISADFVALGTQTDGAGVPTGVLVDGAGSPFVPKTFGGNAVTVGIGGNYPDITTATTVLGSRMKLWDTVNATLFFAINGASPGLAWTAGTFNKARWGNTFVQIGNGTRYFKIKSFRANAPQLELWENYVGTNYIGLTTVELRFYHLDRITLMLLPGQHTAPGTGSTILDAHTLTPGFDVVGFGNESTMIAENDSSPNFVFGNVNDNNFCNFRIAGTEAWGDADSFGYIAADAWGGSEVILDGITFSHLNNNTHSGGILGLPSINGGILRVRNSNIRTAKNPWLLSGGVAARTNANTLVDISHSRIIPSPDTDSWGIDINAAAFAVQDAGTYKLNNVTISQPLDFFMAPLAQTYNDWGGIWVNAAAIVDINNTTIEQLNTSGGSQRTVGLTATAAATINMRNSSIVSAGTTPIGIVNNGATINLMGTDVDAATGIINTTGTVNIRAGSRVKGSTNSINCAAGTVNVSGNADLIGATTGAGTINLATAT